MIRFREEERGVYHRLKFLPLSEHDIVVRRHRCDGLMTLDFLQGTEYAFVCFAFKAAYRRVPREAIHHDQKNGR
jgi:hypothetical protein